MTKRSGFPIRSPRPRSFAPAMGLFLALACGSTASDATSPDLRLAPTGGGSLTGTAWVLTEINGGPALGPEQITLVVDESSAGGYAGCNYYGGTPQVTVGTFRLEDPVATARACADARLMDQESGYLAILAQTSAWRIEAGELTLRTADEETLVFRENG
jgi:heat shock protein HslJ